jgi:hypothetical protein
MCIRVANGQARRRDARILSLRKDPVVAKTVYWVSGSVSLSSLCPLAVLILMSAGPTRADVNHIIYRMHPHAHAGKQS